MSNSVRIGTIVDPAVVGWCSHHGMWLFPTRKIAKRAGKRMFPGSHRDAFRCGDSWHHVPFSGERS